MYCAICGKHVAHCTCPDIEERLRKIGQSTNAGPCGEIGLIQRSLASAETTAKEAEKTRQLVDEWYEQVAPIPSKKCDDSSSYQTTYMSDDKLNWPALRSEISHLIAQWTARKRQLCAAEQDMLQNDIDMLRDLL